MPPGTFPPGHTSVAYVAILPAPPGGSDWSYTIPPRIRAQLTAGRATLNVPLRLGARRVQLYIRHTAGIIAHSANFVAHAPPNTMSYTLHPGCASLPSFVPLDVFLDFPPDLLLHANDVIGVTTTGIRITDFWENIQLQFLQHIEA